MIKKMTEKQLYMAKLEFLKEREIEEVDPKDFYRDLFPVGSFEKKGDHKKIGATGKPNGILVKLEEKNGDKTVRHRILTDELDWVDEFAGQENVILSPIGYYGRRRRSSLASFVYALVFDLDGQGLNQLIDTMHQMKNDIIPPATYIVLSGHGLHLYYLFEKPMPMYPYLQRELNKVKTGLTQRIWNGFTSYDENRQFQPIAQGFRMVGSASKMGKKYPVRAYRFSGKRFTPQELSDYIPDIDGHRQYRGNFNFVDVTPLDIAKEEWPDWYERRIIKGQRKGRWYIKRDLYDWWLKRIQTEVTVGHRYFAVMTLAAMAMKCNISYEELKNDAYSLLKPYEDKTETDDNHFTEHDIQCALQAYKEGSCTYPRDTIAKLAGIPIKENKRNYRTQEVHLKLIRGQKKILKELGEIKEGRPKGSGTKEKLVKDWQKNNPDGKKIDCHRATGLSRVTIDKWWDIALQPKPEDKLAELKKIMDDTKDVFYFEFLLKLFELANKRLSVLDRISLDSLPTLFEVANRMNECMGGSLGSDESYKLFWKTYIETN